jgi:hypothetical protein
VSTNGGPRKSSPRIELLGSDATAGEAAAIVAALERFIAETTVQAAVADTIDGWRRSALLEGVGRSGRGADADPWINT